MLKKSRLFVKLGDGYQFIKIETILMILAADDYTEVILLNGKKLLTLKPLKEWELRLPAQLFCRIHRSTVINITQVKIIEPWFNRSYAVTMNGQEKPVVMSRRYFSLIKN